MARTSSSGAPSKAIAPASTRIDLGAMLLIVLLIPRLMRVLYPAIWVEDDFYLEAAWLTSAGLRPYIDFVHPHFPLLEFIAAGYLKVFGASHFSIEILNGAAIYLTSILTFKLAVRVTSRRAAIGGAILYATSSLVFRYHVYERECFVAPLMLAAAIFALDAEPLDSWSRRIGWPALALIAACLIKLTALIPVAVMVVFIAMVRRRLRDAIALALAVVTALIVATALCYWIYGFEFLFQTFVFHLMKGRSDFLGVMLYPFAILDIQLPLFVIGCVALGRRIRNSPGLILIFTMIAAEYFFYGLLSPTAWAHNYLEVLPFITIVGGIGVDWIIGGARSLSRGVDREDSRPGLRRVGCAVFFIVSIIFIAPLKNENWIQGSVYGFGYVPLEEVVLIGAGLHEATGPDDDVVAPAFICFQANRRELIRFPETYGVLLEAELQYQRDGLVAARRHLGQQNFFSLIAQTAHFWRDPIIASIQNGKLAAVIPDSPIQLLPLVLPPVLLPPAFPNVLVDNGFQPTLPTEHFMLWRRVSERPLK